MGDRTLPAALALRHRVLASHRGRGKVLRPAGSAAAHLFCGKIHCLAARLATLESLAIAVQPRRQQEESGTTDPEDRAGVCVGRHGEELGGSVSHRRPLPACSSCGDVIALPHIDTHTLIRTNVSVTKCSRPSFPAFEPEQRSGHCETLQRNPVQAFVCANRCLPSRHSSTAARR